MAEACDAAAAPSQAETCAAGAEPAMMLRALSGEVFAELRPVPATIADVKAAVEASKDVPSALQKVMFGDEVLEDGYKFDGTSIDLTFVIDESPLFLWDFKSNPDSRLLAGSGTTVSYGNGKYDYVNVISQEPVRKGFHYFEFVMHSVQDEQWCGVSPFKERAGHSGEAAGGWFYYCGRRYQGNGELHAGRERSSVKQMQHVKDGDVIGMLLDADEGILVFMLNGNVEGACAVTTEPLYLSTSLDVENDSVELRKPPVATSPLDLAAVRALELAGKGVAKCQLSASRFGGNPAPDFDDFEDDSDDSDDSDDFHSVGAS